MLRLRQLREAKGLTQTQVALDLGISRQAYSNYEIGKREPDVATLSLMAKYFNVSIDFLVGNEHELESKKIPKDLKWILEEEEITLNGRAMNTEDKEKIYKVIEAMYWDAKEQNKRK